MVGPFYCPIERRLLRFEAGGVHRDNLVFSAGLGALVDEAHLRERLRWGVTVAHTLEERAAKGVDEFLWHATDDLSVLLGQPEIPLVQASVGWTATRIRLGSGHGHP